VSRGEGTEKSGHIVKGGRISEKFGSSPPKENSWLIRGRKDKKNFQRGKKRGTGSKLGEREEG